MAASGPDALVILKKNEINLAFVDLKMPGMDGFELFEKMKAAYPNTRVVIMTAYGSIESAI